MLFKNKEELQEVFNILNAVYGSYWSVYKPLTMVDNTITLEADSYYDPVITLLTLYHYGILDLTVSHPRSEVDGIVIKGADIEALRKLKSEWPENPNVEAVLASFGYKPKEVEEEPIRPIILEGDDTQDIIDRDTWNQYWKLKGKTGPSSGWEIPTASEIYTTLRLFGVDKKERPSSSAVLEEKPARKNSIV